MAWFSPLIKRESNGDLSLYTNLEQDIVQSMQEDFAKPVAQPLAVEHAHGILERALAKLDQEELELAQTIADLSERLRQVRVTQKALTSAYNELSADRAKEPPRIPQAG